MYRKIDLKYFRKKRPHVGNTKAVRTRCLNDHSHRSGLEAQVCDELRLRKIAVDILDYDVEYRVRLGGGGYYWNHYVDFRTHDLDGGFTFVEAKGIQFPDWKRNWGLLQEMYKNDNMIRFQLVTKMGRW